jgi:hypothetical protein
MVLAEAVMLTCMIDALKDQDITVIDIPNAFFQTVVKDEEHCVIIYIRGPLVDILVSIAPDSRCLWPIPVNQKGWPEGNASAVSECCLWNHGGGIIVLQEVHEEPSEEGVQDQLLGWVHGQ